MSEKAPRREACPYCKGEGRVKLYEGAYASSSSTMSHRIIHRWIWRACWVCRGHGQVMPSCLAMTT